MTRRAKLTVAAANVILRSIRWRSHSTEYQVMVKHTFTHLNTGKVVTAYRYGIPVSGSGWGTYPRIWPQNSYRDAVAEIDRLSEADRANAVIFRIKTERPS